MKFGWRGALGVAVSAVALWWTLRGVDYAAVLRYLRDSNISLLLLSTVAATGIFPLRARRWRTILDPVAPRLPFGVLWRPTAIGMMVSNVFPARAGELARAYALTKETRGEVPFTTAFASIAVDRVFDATIVLALMFVAMLDPHFAGSATIGGQPVQRFVWGGVVFATAVFAVLTLMVFLPDQVRAAYHAVASRLLPRLEARGRDVLEAFLAGLGVLRSPLRFVAVLWWTLLHWLLNAFAFWLAFKAVGIEAPFTAALFLQGIIAIGVALPAAPGFFGLFEAFAKAGLAVYAVPENLAVAWAFAFHFLSFIPITVIGAWYFARLGMHMGDLGAVREGAGGATERAPAERRPAKERA
ncbi:MAG TPA: lysylphosphatidylglycerol synthase transmembrane domain-containing protein [Gemmatimonadaceae bacterium]